MFGNTRRIAEAIADGIRLQRPVSLIPVGQADRLPADVDALIIGAPTHAHGLSRPESRAEAVVWAGNEQKHLKLDDAWSDSGVREWLADGSPRSAGWSAPSRRRRSAAPRTPSRSSPRTRA
ncbi:flavodoxin domain-containing protein [Microbacterium sp. LWH3-1.2]